MNIKALLKNTIFSLVGALSGIISIIFSIVVFGMDDGMFENSVRYGADAYTGMQNAAAQTANNVQDLCNIMKVGLGAILLVAGIVLIAHYGEKICKARKELKNNTETETIVETVAE